FGPKMCAQAFSRKCCARTPLPMELYTQTARAANFCGQTPKSQKAPKYQEFYAARFGPKICAQVFSRKCCARTPLPMELCTQTARSANFCGQTPKSQKALSLHDALPI